MSIFKRKQKNIKKSAPAVKLLRYSFKVAGVSYRQDVIPDIPGTTDNYEYSYTKSEIKNECFEYDRIYEYDFYIKRVDFVEEPSNKYDKNAIKVLFNGVHIGYVPKSKTKEVKNIFNNHKVKAVHGDLSGGNYKILIDNSVESDEVNYFADVEIIYYPLDEDTSNG